MAGPHVLVVTDWIHRVNWDDSVVEMGVGRDAVRNAPRYEPQGSFTRDHEAALYSHHARPGYWERHAEAWRHHPPAA